MDCGRSSSPSFVPHRLLFVAVASAHIATFYALLLSPLGSVDDERIVRFLELAGLVSSVLPSFLVPPAREEGMRFCGSTVSLCAGHVWEHCLQVGQNFPWNRQRRRDTEQLQLKLEKRE